MSRTVEIGDDDDRKLEPFGLMNRHQADDVRVFRVGRGQRFVGLSGHELGQLRDVVGQSQEPALLEAVRLLDELTQIRELSLSEKLAEQHGVIARARRPPARSARRSADDLCWHATRPAWREQTARERH